MNLPGNGVGFKGRYDLEIWRAGKLIKQLSTPNTVLLPAIDDILNKYFLNGTTAAAWYMGLVSNVGYTTFANTDTMSAHSGWTECIAYTGPRPTWTPTASSGNANTLTNATQVSFTINAALTAVRGLFLVNDSTLNGTAGMLASTAAFNEGVQNFNSGDIAKVTFTITGAPI